MDRNIENMYTPNPVSVPSNTLAHDCMALMREKHISFLIVSDNKKPVGIFAEVDIVRNISKTLDYRTIKIRELMNTSLVTAPKTVSVFEATYLLTDNNSHHLIIVDLEGNLIGVVTQTDIFSYYSEHYFTGSKNEKEFLKQSHYLDNQPKYSLDMAVVITDLDFNVIYFNHDSTSMFQVDEDKIIGHSLSQLLKCDSFPQCSLEQVVRELKEKGEYCFNHLCRQGNSNHQIESRLTQLHEKEKLVGYILVSRDITEKLHTQKRLLLASHVFECAIEGIMVTSANGTIQAVNPAFTEITGYSEEDAIGNNPRMLQSNRQSPEFYKRMWKTVLDTGRWQGEIWNRRKSGEIYPQRLSIASAKDLSGNITQFTAVFYDITEIKEKEEKINHRAYHDSLTELPNRLLFKDRLDQAITRARRSGRQLAVMFIDIDNFKRLNDTQGHHAGDLFLQKISTEFRGLLRDQDTVSRFGGDEFTILLDDNNSIEQSIVVAQKILNLFRKPFQINDNEFYLGASIGIANYPADGSNSEILIKNADTAMYHAKENGRNHFQIFKVEMETLIKQRVSLESELRKALGRNQLQIYYQPIINLHTQSIASIEALLRWDNANNSVPPNEFIPIAEESGLIVPIGEWVLQQTCRQMSKWQIDDVSGLAISVNLSARQFREKELLGTIERILDETNLKPEQLHLEITESSMMDDMENSIATLTAFKKIGIRILMDDFGTGYSSLTCLQRFPVDVLKLDHTFIQTIDKNEDSARLAAGIISMAKDLNLEVVAEGVENEAQLKFLEEHGCDMVQGYLFHKPLTEEKLRKVLRQQKIL